MAVLSLTTDFGLKDGNVGVMKGVIWGICPSAQIADLSHTIQPQNIPEAALIILRSTLYFPDGSVHVIVVDPGVGTARRPIAARVGRQFYVAPDNGVLTLLFERAEQEGWPVEVTHLDQPKYWLPKVSHVFHGRDIFAPCGAYLASGVSLAEIGTPVGDPVRLELPKPRRTEFGWLGEVIHIDHFGNLASNIREEHLAEMLAQKERIHVQVGGVDIPGLVDTFGERPPGELAALLGSTGNLIVSVVNGNAAARLGVIVGDEFRAVLKL
jgi:S-adenosylmethionine hydrolase